MKSGSLPNTFFLGGRKMSVWSNLKGRIRRFRDFQPVLNEQDVLKKRVSQLLKGAKADAAQKAEVRAQLMDMRRLATIEFIQRYDHLSLSLFSELQGYLKRYKAETGPEAMRNILAGINEQFNYRNTPEAEWLHLMEKFYDYNLKNLGEITGLRNLERQALGLQAKQVAEAAREARQELEAEAEKVSLLLQDADPGKNKNLLAADYAQTYEFVAEILDAKRAHYGPDERTPLLYAFRRFVKDCGGDQTRINHGIRGADQYGSWEVEAASSLAELAETAQVSAKPKEQVVLAEQTKVERGL